MKLGNLKSGGAAFLLCDMQERFRPAISNFESVLKNSQKLVNRNACSYTLSQMLQLFMELMLQLKVN